MPAGYRLTPSLPLRKIFDQVVHAEWQISDQYEQMQQQGESIPSTPVYTQEYRQALQGQIIHIVDEGQDSYFDYNLFEVNVAGLINEKGLVKIGGKIFQFGLEEKKIIEDGNFFTISRLDRIHSSNAKQKVTVIHYSLKDKMKSASQFGYHEWLYCQKEGNGWTFSGSRKFRMFITGSSYIDDTNGQKLYVTNVLRLEGLKKNIWGNWKYKESYTTSGTVRWQWDYRISGSKPHLNSSYGDSPYSWQYPGPLASVGVNNAFLYLAPHTSGYYPFPNGYDCGDTGLCGYLQDGVRLSNVSGSGYIDGVYLPLDYVDTNI